MSNQQNTNIYELYDELKEKYKSKYSELMDEIDKGMCDKEKCRGLKNELEILLKKIMKLEDRMEGLEDIQKSQKSGSKIEFIIK